MDTRSVGGSVGLRLPRDIVAGEIARAFVRDRLADVGYLGDADDVVLVVSELVDNAFRHGTGVPVLAVSGSPELVRAEVTGGGDGVPAPRPSGPTGGWGLVLVDRLSLRWGTDLLPVGGKVVWCELAATGDRD